LIRQSFALQLKNSQRRKGRAELHLMSASWPATVAASLEVETVGDDSLGFDA
jgi:hypothetical protein